MPFLLQKIFILKRLYDKMLEDELDKFFKAGRHYRITRLPINIERT